MNNFAHTPETENALRDLCRSLFAEILVRDSQDDTTWKRRLETFEKNGLLSFRLPSPIKAPEFEVDNSKLDDPRYRRYAIRKLKAPRPSKYTYVRLPIDRSRLDSAEYVRDIATLLAFKWVNKMLPVESAHEVLLLLKLDINVLTRALDKMGLHQSTGTNVAALLLRMSVEELVDNNEGMKALLANMKSEIGAIRCQFEREVRAIASEAIAAANTALAPITAEAGARCDAWIKELNERSAARNAHTEAILEAERSRDPEAEWKAALAESERKYREANRLSPGARWFVRGATVAVTVVLAFFLEIGDPGITPVEFLTDLFGR